MPLVPKTFYSDELAEMNDATAAIATDGGMCSISPSSLNALICEVQAWRRENPGKRFSSGPNEIRDVK